MLSLFENVKNISIQNGLFSMLTSLANKAARPLANMITAYVTRNATPAAKAYAVKKTNKLCDKIPQIAADLAANGLSIGMKGFTPAAGTELISFAYKSFTNKQSSLRQVARVPFKAYKAYKKYQAFNQTATF